MKAAFIALSSVGIVGAVLTVPLYVHDPERMSAAICTSWWVGLTFAIGALALVMTLNVSHATWFVLFRPITSSIAVAMPLLALGFVPAALVAHHVYPWAGADHGIPHEILERIERTRPWMSAGPVYVRTVLSLGVWSTLAIWLHARAASSRARVASAAGFPLLAITATVTPFDWMMHIEPGWTSAMYAIYVVVSGFYGAVGVVAVASWVALRRGLLGTDVRRDHFHAHGRLMLTAVSLWGYLAFFQFMLQWVGNLPAEAQFYARRAQGSWAVVSWGLVFGHFVVPFFLLLSRPLKRNASALAGVGALMAFAHIADIVWLVLPSRTAGFFPHALAPLVAVLGLGGAWALWRFSRLSAVAARDPDYVTGVRYESP